MGYKRKRAYRMIVDNPEDRIGISVLFRGYACGNEIRRLRSVAAKLRYSRDAEAKRLPGRATGGPWGRVARLFIAFTEAPARLQPPQMTMC